MTAMEIAGADHPAGRREVPRRAMHFACWFLLGSLTFAILPLSVRFPVALLLKLQLGLALALLVAAAVATRLSSAGSVVPLLYAHFVACVAVLLGATLGGQTLQLLPLRAASPSWIAVAKVSEGTWRVIPILLLMTVGGADLDSLYLARGRLRFGLALGASGMTACVAIAFLPHVAAGTFGTLVGPQLPWILLFVLANGFSEELLFRGLFLRRLEPFLGSGLSNVLTALVFTAVHLQVRNLAQVPLFVAAVFPLALAWGYLTQKSGSLWGAALFHAGADTLLVVGIYASL